MKKLFFFLLPAALLLTSCNLFNNYGKKVEFGESEVYYKGDGVKEADAQKLGDYLIEQELLDKETKKSVQLTHDGEDYLLHFVVDEQKFTDATRLYWWKLQYDISKEVFKSKPTRITLANEKLEDKEVLNPIALYKVGKSSLYYDNSDIKKNEAKRLAEFLTGIKLMGVDKESDVFYQKEKGTSTVRVVVNPKKINEQVLPVFSFWQEQMREKLFDGSKAKMVLTSTLYEDMDPLPKLTAAQRQTFETETTQTTNNTETTVDSLTTQTSRSGVLRLPNQ